VIRRATLLFAACSALLAAAEGGASSPLHQAAYNEDLAAVKKLIANGAAVNSVNRYGVTALSLAAENGNAAIVEALLAAGANPNTARPGGETPLMSASRAGSLAAVVALLKAGADVHAADAQFGQTALMWAAAEGHVDVIERLVEHGAKVNQRVGSGFTPLLFAVREGQLGAARALLAAGANINESIQPDPNWRRRLSPGPNPSRAGTSALMLAVINAHFDLAAYLLEKGADPNVIGPGYTALHAITIVRKPGGGDNDPAPLGSGKMTSIDMIRTLAKHGADLNARMTRHVNLGLTRINTKGATPMFMAARSGDAEMMRLLASLGADPKISNADGSTVLHAAAGLGTRSPGEDAGTEEEVVEAVQVALDLGLDPNAIDQNGETPMHSAAYKNYGKVCELLAAKGADIKIWDRKNKAGWTPLEIAEGYRFGNFKPSPPTIEALRRIMVAAGHSIAIDHNKLRNQSDYIP
jgi:uncharacterized protein